MMLGVCGFSMKLIVFDFACLQALPLANHARSSRVVILEPGDVGVSKASRPNLREPMMIGPSFPDSDIHVSLLFYSTLSLTG